MIRKSRRRRVQDGVVCPEVGYGAVGVVALGVTVNVRRHRRVYLRVALIVTIRTQGDHHLVMAVINEQFTTSV